MDLALRSRARLDELRAAPEPPALSSRTCSVGPVGAGSGTRAPRGGARDSRRRPAPGRLPRAGGHPRTSRVTRPRDPHPRPCQAVNASLPVTATGRTLDASDWRTLVGYLGLIRGRRYCFHGRLLPIPSLRDYLRTGPFAQSVNFLIAISPSSTAAASTSGRSVAFPAMASARRFAVAISSHVTTPALLAHTTR